MRGDGFGPVEVADCSGEILKDISDVEDIRCLSVKVAKVRAGILAVWRGFLSYLSRVLARHLFTCWSSTYTTKTCC